MEEVRNAHKSLTVKTEKKKPNEILTQRQKNNCVLDHSKKAYTGSTGTTPLVFKLGPSRR
jgi:hypothetical protein